ncbi:MAG: sulfotransferase, partial [Xanthomonadales bacterium]|nr:sulfotransferase [Xanthomonadales bacterium]
EAALGANVRSTPGNAQRRPSGARQRLKRSIFVVCPPRSGSSLLFETLAQAPGLYTIGGESHGVIEGIASLSPARRQWASNRLLASDADRETARKLAAAFLERAHDRDGHAPPASGPLRLLEKTPKNALRVPFLAEAFPNAMFVYLYRDPRETISSMLDAWRSGRFVTYPGLPGWTGLPWSLLLVPGWQHLRGRELAEIVALQWAACVEILLDDMQKLPPHRWCVADYAQLVQSPQDEIERLCGFLRLPWDRQLVAPLPLSRYTLKEPNPDKWKTNAQDLEIALPLIEKTAARARELFAQVPVG